MINRHIFTFLSAKKKRPEERFLFQFSISHGWDGLLLIVRIICPIRFIRYKSVISVGVHLIWNLEFLIEIIPHS